jgi:hypothetical protein
MTTGYESEYSTNGNTPRDESIGNLIGQVAGDVSTLFRQEVALAKAELKDEAVKAGKAGSMLAGVGFAGYIVAVLLSLALVFALGAAMPLGWAALIVAVIWANHRRRPVRRRPQANEGRRPGARGGRSRH